MYFTLNIFFLIKGGGASGFLPSLFLVTVLAAVSLLLGLHWR